MGLYHMKIRHTKELTKYPAKIQTTRKLITNSRLQGIRNEKNWLTNDYLNQDLPD